MCNCNENINTNPCIPCGQTPCSPPENCDCPIKDLKSDCIIFTENLTCTNVESGQTLTETLVQLDQGICDKVNQLSQSINLVNTGTGEDIYNGIDGIGRRKIKRIKEGDNLIDIVANTDDISIGINETNLTSFIQNNQKIYDLNNVGTGTKIYQEPDPTPVGNTTTFNLKSLKSNTLQITSTEDEITINSMDNDFRYLTSFYVNSNYTPTVNSPADGSIIRPFPTWEEAKTAFIGTGTIQQPQYSGGAIILQTSSIATTNPTVNTLTIRFENSSSLTYSGSDPYMFDTEVLYPLVPKISPRNNLQYDIYLTLEGQGVVTRNNGIGLVRGMGTDRPGSPAQLGDKKCYINVGNNEKDIFIFLENTNYPDTYWNSPNGGATTYPNGDLLEDYYGSPHRYTTILPPTLPLFYSQYQSGSPFTYGINCKGSITIQTLANTAIRVVGDTLFAGSSASLNLLTSGNYISVLDGTKVTGFSTNYAYKPHPNKNFIECLDGAATYFKDINIKDSSGYSVSSIDNFFKATGNGYISFGDLNLGANFYVKTLFNLADVSNTYTSFNIANTLNGSKIDLPNLNYFIDTNQSTFTLYMPNTVVKTFLNKSVNPVTINTNTNGTLSSFKGTPLISGIGSFADDSVAISTGLIQNSLYFNTTNNALDVV